MIDSESFRPITTTPDYSGRYTDVELIRTTSHAMLYRMRKAGRLFIAKTACGADARSLELLKREYELTLGLSHPHIIHVYTYEASTPVGPAIIMEYVDGCTLTEYLASRPDKAARQRVFEQLLSATAYLHKAGVLHNDLKPDNILITRTNHDVRLIDFGFSDDDSHDRLRALGGTRGYASPELAAQAHGIDTRSDIYSLGRIMQQLFPGRYKRIAGRCTHPKCERRYADVDSLAHAWRYRRLPLQLVGALVIAALILLPTLLYVGERQQRLQYNKAIEHERQVVDSLFQAIDKGYEQAYLLTLDSIRSIASTAAAPYSEALLMISRFYQRTGEIKTEALSSVTDKTTQSQLESYGNHQYSIYQTQLVKAAEQWMKAQFDW